MNKNTEDWIGIPGYETLYAFNRMGQVKRLARYIGHKGGEILIKERLLTITKGKNGYMVVKITVNYRGKAFYIHRLLAEAFIPNPENKPQVNHINGIRDDNRLENLEWATNGENQIHSIRVLGKKVAFGEKQRSAKLKESDIPHIKNLYSSGKLTYKQIANMYSVSDRTIGAVVKDKYWRHLIR